MYALAYVRDTHMHFPYGASIQHLQTRVRRVAECRYGEDGEGEGEGEEAPAPPAEEPKKKKHKQKHHREHEAVDSGVV